MRRRARRLAETAATWFAVVLCAFLVTRALPGDAAEALLLSQGIAPTPELAADLARQAGFDRPLLDQFVAFIARLAVGDLGVSLKTGLPVLPTLMEKLPVSLAIGLGGLVLGAAIAFALALAGAVRGADGADRATRLLALIVQAVPGFAAGLAIIWLFGVELRWIRPFTGGAFERIVLPILLVAIYVAGALTRPLAAEMRRALAAPFSVAVRAKGVSARGLAWRHAAPFGALALVSALRAEASWVIGGTAAAEVLFGAPGVSAWVVDAVSIRDLAVVQAYVLVIAVWMLAVHGMLDVIARRIDPRRAS